MDNVEKNYKIAFISDLHFDNISENTDNGISFLEAEEKKAEFIACLKRYFNDYIVCIVGDCYSNYKEMLNFIEELEQNKICSSLSSPSLEFLNARADDVCSFNDSFLFSFVFLFLFSFKLTRFSQ